eukprot:13376425-Ditylum_brightwellii.AAC.1
MNDTLKGLISLFPSSFSEVNTDLNSQRTSREFSSDIDTTPSTTLMAPVAKAGPKEGGSTSMGKEDKEQGGDDKVNGTIEEKSVQSMASTVLFPQSVGTMNKNSVKSVVSQVSQLSNANVSRLGKTICFSSTRPRNIAIKPISSARSGATSHVRPKPKAGTPLFAPSPAMHPRKKRTTATVHTIDEGS